MRYWIIAILTGTFKNIADEFYRRIALPYEKTDRLRKAGMWTCIGNMNIRSGKDDQVASREEIRLNNLC
jgi:hypothetical protein